MLRIDLTLKGGYTATEPQRLTAMLGYCMHLHLFVFDQSYYKVTSTKGQGDWNLLIGMMVGPNPNPNPNVFSR